MPKHIELPPRVAQAFVRDMRAFFKAKNQLKQDEIAARQLHALHAFQHPREKKLRLADVKAMFLQMRDHALLGRSFSVYHQADGRLSGSRNPFEFFQSCDMVCRSHRCGRKIPLLLK
jgi:hypothetical protein